MMSIRLTNCTLMVVFLLGFCEAVGAGPELSVWGPGPDVSTEPEAGTKAGALPKVAVLEFVAGDKVTPNQASMLADLVRETLHKSGKDQYEILDRKFMKERLAEKDLMTLGEFEGTKDQLVACGKSLGVEKIVGGQVTAFGELWVLNVQIVDVATGRVDGTSTHKAGLSSDLLEAAPKAALELLGLAVQADKIARTERERAERERREALEKLWEEQKEAIKVQFKRVPSSVRGETSVEYRVLAKNPTEQPAVEVRLELRGSKENQVHEIRFGEIKPHEEGFKTIEWKWPGKPRECVVIAVGGDYDGPKEKRCSMCKGLGTVRCRTCLGKLTIKCERCQGKGLLVEMYYEDRGAYKVPKERTVTCPACEGSGKQACPFCDKGRVPCPKCHGKTHGAGKR